MEMTITNQPTVWQPAAGDVTAQSLEASRTGLALLSNAQHMDFSLVTAEGDKVTLSLDSRAAALIVMNEEVQDDGQGSVSYEKSELTMGLYQRDMTFTVEGQVLYDAVEETVSRLEGVDEATVNVVADPPWSIDRINPKIRSELVAC